MTYNPYYQYPNALGISGAGYGSIGYSGMPPATGAGWAGQMPGMPSGGASVWDPTGMMQMMYPGMVNPAALMMMQQSQLPGQGSYYNGGGYYPQQQVSPYAQMQSMYPQQNYQQYPQQPQQLYQQQYAAPPPSQGTDSITYLTQLLNTQGLNAVLSAVSQQGQAFALQLKSYLQANPALPLSQELLGSVQTGTVTPAPTDTVVSALTDNTSATLPDTSNTPRRTGWQSSAADNTAPATFELQSFLADLQDNPASAASNFRRLKTSDKDAAVQDLIGEMQNGMTSNSDGTYTFNDEAQAIYKFLFKQSGYSKAKLKEYIQQTITDPGGSSDDSSSSDSSSDSSSSDSSSTDLDPTHLYYQKLISGSLHFNSGNSQGGTVDPQTLFYKDPKKAASDLASASENAQKSILKTIATSFISDLANSGKPSDDSHKKEFQFLKAVFPDDYANALKAAASEQGSLSSEAQTYLNNLLGGAQSLSVGDSTWSTAGASHVAKLGISAAGDGTAAGDGLDLTKISVNSAASNEVTTLLNDTSATNSIPSDIATPDLLEAFAKQWMSDASTTGGISADKAQKYQALDQYFRNNDKDAYQSVLNDVKYTDSQHENNFAKYLQTIDTNTGADSDPGVAMSDFISGNIGYTDHFASVLTAPDTAAKGATSDAKSAAALLQQIAAQVISDMASSNSSDPSDNDIKYLKFIKKIFPDDYQKALTGALNAYKSKNNSTDVTQVTSFVNAIAAKAFPASDKAWDDALGKATAYDSKNHPLSLDSGTSGGGIQTDLNAVPPDQAADTVAQNMLNCTLNPKNLSNPFPPVGTDITRVMQSFAWHWMQDAKDPNFSPDSAKSRLYLQWDQYFREKNASEYTGVLGDMAYTDGLNSNNFSQYLAKVQTPQGGTAPDASIALSTFTGNSFTNPYADSGDDLPPDPSNRNWTLDQFTTFMLRYDQQNDIDPSTDPKTKDIQGAYNRVVNNGYAPTSALLREIGIIGSTNSESKGIVDHPNGDDMVKILKAMYPSKTFMSLDVMSKWNDKEGNQDGIMYDWEMDGFYQSMQNSST